MTSNAASRETKGGVAVLVLLGAVVFGGMQYYALDRDLDSFKSRAQVAANPTDMLTYLRQLRTNIVRHNAHTGHTALVMKTPATDLALHLQAVERVIDRLQQIEQLPSDSAAYQAGLDDVRGIVRELPAIAGGVFWVQYGWWLALVLVGCVFARME